MPTQFFLWLILNVLLVTEAQQNSTFSCICTVGHQNGMVWWCVLNHRLLLDFLWHRRKR